MTTRGAVWVAAAVILVAGVFPARATLTEELHKSYPLDGDGRVSLRNVHGDVHIAAWDRNEVQVDAIKRGESKDAMEEARIVIDASSGSISIRTQYPERGTRRRSASVEYTVKVPRRARLFAIEAVHGDVEITGVTGDVKASTVHGNVDAAFERVEGAPGISLNTVHGNISLSLPGGAGADFSGSTVHGKIDSDMGLRRGRRSISGQVGDGRARVRLNTVHGDIRITGGAGGRRVHYV